ncbi:hypothetical protein [Nocardia sp. NPDC057030]|uniref:hypothetical protein n=1 Tax=unclassified Nocardia TaxID=2637762 RepID=UPI003637F345
MAGLSAYTVALCAAGLLAAAPANALTGINKIGPVTKKGESTYVTVGYACEQVRYIYVHLINDQKDESDGFGNTVCDGKFKTAEIKVRSIRTSEDGTLHVVVGLSKRDESNRDIVGELVADEVKVTTAQQSPNVAAVVLYQHRASVCGRHLAQRTGGWRHGSVDGTFRRMKNLGRCGPAATADSELTGRCPR